MIEECEVIENAVDWITATALYQKEDCAVSGERCATLASRLLLQEEQKKNRMRTWSMMGFKGFACGQVQCGIGGQGYLFRLSGEVAATHWREVYALSTNVSRVDCQFTVRHDGAWIDRAVYHADEVRRYQREKAPHMKVTLIDGGKHGRSLCIGSRASTQYGRIYDKEKESKLECYRDCWRYEVEFKKSAAEFVCAELAAEDPPGSSPGSQVAKWMERRQINPGQLLMDVALPCSHKKSSDALRSLEWFRRCVKPSVDRCLAWGSSRETLDALGIDGATLRALGWQRPVTSEPTESEDTQCHNTQRSLLQACA